MMTLARTRAGRLVAGIALTGAVLVTPTAQAGAFDASTVGGLLLIGIATTDPNDDLTGLTIDGFPDFDTDSVGTGTADAGADVGIFDDPIGLGVGFDAFLEPFVNGQADTGEDVDAFADNSVFIDLFNGTDDEITIDFLLSWDLEAGASAPESGADAYAEAYFSFETIGNVIAGADFISELVMADALFGPPEAMTGGDNAFTLRLAPTELATIDIAAGASGFAVGAPVPAPPVTMLMALGFVALVGVRRKLNTKQRTS